MKGLKYFLILIALVFAFGASATIVKAHGFGTSALAIDFTHVDINNLNCGFIINLADAKANTGLNFTGGTRAMIDSGAAVAGTDSLTNMNSNSTAGLLVDMQSGPIAVNLGGDSFFGPKALAVDVKWIDVDNFNGGMVINDSSAWANSGLNMAWGYKSKITSGEAMASTATTTNLNSNSTYIELWDTGLVGPIAANVDFDYGLAGLSGFGMPFGFGKQATAVEANVVLVDNVNLGLVDNYSLAMANTGLNMTGGYKSRLTTGAATASTETTTNLNQSMTGVVVADTGLVGPVAGNVDFDFGGFGPGCHPMGSLALAVDANVVSVDNLNFGGVINTSGAFANSGMNYAGKGAKGLTTGAAVASTATTSNVNSNTTGVMIADSSSGPIAGNVDLNFGCGAQIGDSCLGMGGVGPIAANVNTIGGKSVALDLNLATVDNTNVAMVVNTSTAMANSGENISGGGAISTGMATASTTTSSNVNKNETEVVIIDGAGVGPVAANIDTSFGTAVAVEVTVADVDNVNKAEVINDSVANANTGGNVTQGSTQCCCQSSSGGSVTTGDAVSSTTTTNNVNSNTTTFVINQ